MGLALVLTLGALWPRAVETGSWGLSFREAGQPPVGNASTAELQALNAVYMGSPEEKRVYLTFDAGYENGYTAGILDVLKAHDVPAVFFLVGSYLRREPELVKRMVDEGHIVANHTEHHYDMSQIAQMDAFRKELELVEESYRTLTGQEMEKYYRPPQGIYSKENLAMAKELGYRTVFWSLAYVDWNNDAQPTREEAMEKLLGRIHNGAVILLHSTSKTNGEILDDFLTALEEQGYTFGTMADLFAQKPED